MNSKKFKGCVILAVAGIVAFIAGVTLAIIFSDTQGIMQGLPFALIGIGLVSFGGGLGGALSYRTLKTNPNLAKQKEIEVNDERNIEISCLSKARTWEFTTYLFAALIIFLAVMQVELIVTLVFVIAFFVRLGVFVYFLNKYHKEM